MQKALFKQKFFKRLEISKTIVMLEVRNILRFKNLYKTNTVHFFQITLTLDVLICYEL